ncbi:MAG: transcriptional regulator [Candidatus Sulfotelmatobacter sp.]|nr:transcriptional regulator [Candidatus Sulfotelmatobacter sp.]
MGKPPTKKSARWTRRKNHTTTPQRDAQVTLGANVRKAREALDLSQEAFADRCNFHRSHMGEIERGESNVTIATMLILARTLKTTIYDLLKGV